MKKILLLITTITFSLCAIVSSEEETKDAPQSADSEQTSENTNEQKDSTPVATNNSPRISRTTPICSVSQWKTRSPTCTDHLHIAR